MGGRSVDRGPPVGRHLTAFGLTIAILWVFLSIHNQASRNLSGLSNKVFADTSVALLCLILMLGPLARFVPRARRLVPWGRELGIAMFVTASVHVVMVLPHYGEAGWIDRIAGSVGEDVLGAANWAGWLAFVAALVLASTSNDLSHRLLGRGWKFVQRQAYLLFVLTIMHSVVWLEWNNPDYVIPTEWFWYLAALVVIFQFAGFWHTVLATRGPSPQRAPAKRPFQSEGVWAGAGKWLVVVVLWGGMFLYPMLDPWSGSDVSEEAIAAICARYDEAGIQRFDVAGIQGLADYLPEEVRTGNPDRDWATIIEIVEECEASE